MLNREKEDTYISAWGPALIWGTVILVFSILPYGSHPQLTVGYFDKMAHFFEYTVLAIILARGLYGIGRPLSIRNLLIILILGGGYGILMELVQRYIPGREASLGDVMANLAGMVFGIIMGRILLWQK